MRLIVGPDGKEFVIHESLLITMSEEMGKKVSRDKTINLPTTDPIVVACLLEFAYSGDFESPGFEQMNPNSILGQTERIYAEPDFGRVRALSRAWGTFVSKPSQYEDDQIVYDVAWEEAEGDDFCTIAKVYDIAEDYKIEELKNLCCSKLHRLMVYHQQHVDIVQFLSHCADRFDSRDLIELAVEYATLMMEFNKDDKDFIALLAAKPRLAAAILCRLTAIHREYAESGN